MAYSQQNGELAASGNRTLAIVRNQKKEVTFSSLSPNSGQTYRHYIHRSLNHYLHSFCFFTCTSCWKVPSRSRNINHFNV